MLLSALFIVVIFFICARCGQINILCLLIALMPFHAFISQLFVFKFGTSGLFPMWRDICILFLFCKTNPFKKAYSTFFIVPCLCVIYIVFVFFSFWNVFPKGVSFFRIYMDVFLLFFSLSCMNFDKKSLTRVSYVFCISSILVCVSGFIQYFLLRDFLHVLFDDYEYDKNGTLYYKFPNLIIMGYERMTGLMKVPNMFGVYNSLFTLFSFLYLFNYKKLSTGEKKFLWICLILSFSCLLLSFSRAGWGILLGSVCVFELKFFHKFSKILFVFTKFFLGLSFLLILSAMIFPESIDVIQSTLMGKEDSFANRSSLVSDSYELLSNSYLGNGIGGTDIETGHFFAESSFLNLLYEIGWLGVLLWYSVFVFIFIKTWKDKNFHVCFFSSLILPSLLISFLSSNVMAWPFVFYLFSFLGMSVNRSVKFCHS